MNATTQQVEPWAKIPSKRNEGAVLRYTLELGQSGTTKVLQGSLSLGNDLWLISPEDALVNLGCHLGLGFRAYEQN